MLIENISTRLNLMARVMISLSSQFFHHRGLIFFAFGPNLLGRLLFPSLYHRPPLLIASHFTLIMTLHALCLKDKNEKLQSIMRNNRRESSLKFAKYRFK